MRIATTIVAASVGDELFCWNDRLEEALFAFVTKKDV